MSDLVTLQDVTEFRDQLAAQVMGQKPNYFEVVDRPVDQGAILFALFHVHPSGSRDAHGFAYCRSLAVAVELAVQLTALWGCPVSPAEAHTRICSATRQFARAKLIANRQDAPLEMVTSNDMQVMNALFGAQS